MVYFAMRFFHEFKWQPALYLINSELLKWKDDGFYYLWMHNEGNEELKEEKDTLDMLEKAFWAENPNPGAKFGELLGYPGC
jgi:hypothetical protein